MTNTITVPRSTFPALIGSVDKMHEIMASMPQDDSSTVEHMNCNGMYLRKFSIKAGVTVVSRVHKKEYYFIMAKGKCAIKGNDDDPAMVYEAGDLMISPKGAKRVVHAIEDSIIVSVHRTDKHNLQKIEKELVEFNDNDLFTVNDTPKPGVLTIDQYKRISQ